LYLTSHDEDDEEHAGPMLLGVLHVYVYAPLPPPGCATNVWRSCAFKATDFGSSILAVTALHDTVIGALSVLVTPSASVTSTVAV